MATLTPKVIKAKEWGKNLKYKQDLIDDTKKLLAKLKDDGYVWNKDKADWVKSSGEIFIMVTASDDQIEALVEHTINTLVTEYEYGNLSLSNPEWKPTQAKERDRETIKDGFSSVYLYFQNTED